MMSKHANELRDLARKAAVEQSCPVCYNSRAREDECPRCHGDHPNMALIDFLRVFAEAV